MQDSDSEKEPEPEVEPPIHANEDIIETSLERNSPEIVVRARKSRFRDADSPDSRSFNTDGGGNSSVSSMPLANLPPKRSREEILHDVVSFFTFLLFFNQFIVNCETFVNWTIQISPDAQGPKFPDGNFDGSDERRNWQRVQRGLEPLTRQRYRR